MFLRMFVISLYFWSQNVFAIDEMVMPPSTQFEVNGGALMRERSGYNVQRVRPVTTAPYPNLGGTNGSDGAFRINCTTTQMGFFDPIVYPGQARRSHLHVFFGHTGLTADTDVTGNALALSGRSSCTGGTVNRSGYWTPTLINTSGPYKGFPWIPLRNNVYYKSSLYNNGPNVGNTTVPPAGLRMIAGNPSNTAAGDGTTYRYYCLLANGSTVDGGENLTTAGATCVNGQTMTVLVIFPQCWDGVNLDSGNHQSHMAYENVDTGCPGSHPIPLPAITFNITYAINANQRPENARLSSDTYDLAIPGGRSMHGDWINGWDQTFLAMIVNNCVRIGVDCHDHLLNDGTTYTNGNTLY